jgi:hypothetical protein
MVGVKDGATVAVFVDTTGCPELFGLFSSIRLQAELKKKISEYISIK